MPPTPGNGRGREPTRVQSGSRRSQSLAFTSVGSLSQRRSYDIVVEGLLARSKRVIPVVDDKSRHAMRWGILLEQPFGDQLLDSVVQSKSRSLLIMSSSPSGNAMH